ncbi:hypothetical protein [uncultured Shewanella sp.]|uniref:hypothetical protein n=1 Tax=uncultured Shewanella sp. TaxID=173975 RepID=UPI002628C7E5|nr:hypothetical protein [uncultured Shewanella sp.]
MEWRGKQSLWGSFDSISDSLSNKPERQYLEQAANDPVVCDLRLFIIRKWAKSMMVRLGHSLGKELQPI